MADLLQETYLPEFEKKQIRDSNVYKLLKENNEDTSVLEGYEKDPDAVALELTGENKPEDEKNYLKTFGEFLHDTTEDTLSRIAVAGVNGADVAANLMPVAFKIFEKSPLAVGMPKDFFNPRTEEQVYDTAKHISNNLDKARQWLYQFQEDDGLVKEILGLIVQDATYSVPAYNYMTKAGVPKMPAFIISGALGALGVENIKDGQKTYFDPFAKDITELKNLIGILPNTPEDQIADEVVQALEYGAFSYAIPKIIDGFKFMKRYIPAMTATGTTAAVMMPTEAEGSPFKAIANAVFKSTAKEAVEQKITKGSGEQIYNTIKNTPGVKVSELKWLGLEEYLKGKKNVTQKEVLDFIQANRIDVNERRFGDFVDTAASKKSKPIDKLSDEEVTKIQNRIFESMENNNDDSLKFVADHIDYLRAAGGKRIDGFPIKKTKYREGFDAPDITDQNYNFSNFMNDHALYRAVEGLDDLDGDPIRNIWFDNTFANYYEVFGIKSKGTKNLLTDEMEKKLYTDFAEKNMSLPEEMVRNADVHNGFHIQADEFENFKKYLDENGAYIMEYNHMEIPKDVREAVFNEMNIRSNEEMFYQHGNDNIMDALGEWTDSAFMPQAKWIDQTEPGGENYSELVFTLSKGGENVGSKIPVETGVTKHSNTFRYGINTSPHFGTPGEFAHVRFKTRMNGNMKVLSVEEMQSDLVQQVKLHNKEITEKISDPNPDNFIDDFPFKNTWYELTLKRLIRYAADNGFDAISIPKGSVIQDRYGLTRRIDDFNITMFDPKRKEVGLMARDQNGVTQIDDLYTFDRVEKEFGKDVLDRILKKGPKVDDSEDYQKIKLAKQIEIGGEGKNQLYNKTIPAFLKKYGKKWNAKVYDENIKRPRDGIRTDDERYSGIEPTSNMPVTIIEITPEMKKSVQGTPQPLFEIFGGVSLSTWIADEVSDSMQNNNISQTTN